MSDIGLSPAAESCLPAAFSRACRNLAVVPHWLDAGRFWYRRETGSGVEYRLFTCASGENRVAFDHAALTRALPDLPFDGFDILAAGKDGVLLAHGRRRWHFGPNGLTAQPDRPHADDESLSPDGRWVIFRREGDLWLRPADGGPAQRLTSTAQPHFEWAKSPDQSLETIHLRRQGVTLPPILLWSPDSTRIFTYQLDERAVREIALVQNVAEDGGHAPVLHLLRNAFAGDAELPIAHQAIIEVPSGRIIPCTPTHVTETSIIERREVWWASDGSHVYWLDHDRHERAFTLIETNALTGTDRRILTESAPTFVDVNLAYGGRPNIRVLGETDEVVWFSQRDGWGHLYLHDLTTGAERAQITRGAWPVVDLLHVDPNRREALFLCGAGEDTADPYQRRLCAAPLDGGPMRVLTPEGADHAVAVRELGWAEVLQANTRTPLPEGTAPDGRHVVVTSASATGLGESWLCRVADGARLARLEVGECDLPLAPVERVEVLAADGRTRLFGMLWRPLNFDAKARYPLLDMVYPGPQCIQTPRSALPADEVAKIAMAQAAAALGIAVLMLDGRGTPYRSKAFHDLCHGNLADPGHLSDHVAALGQLGRDRPWLDLSRVAIMGHSAGGHAAARAILAHPQVFHVAVATAGSHDLRGYNHCWPEKWQGPLIRHENGTTSYDAVANALLADRLEGDLLLGHGDMDENVLPALTLQLASALITAGKRFDLLLTPNDDHASFKTNPYVQRRLLQFLAEKLRAADGSGKDDPTASG